MLTIHNRIQVILAKKDKATWIDIPNPTDNTLVDLLKPYPTEAMTMYQVSKIVNSPHNDVPTCIKPVKLS
jgi:putative SOS response-associated peptidase YedK